MLGSFLPKLEILSDYHPPLSLAFLSNGVCFSPSLQSKNHLEGKMKELRILASDLFSFLSPADCHCTMGLISPLSLYVPLCNMTVTQLGELLTMVFIWILSQTKSKATIFVMIISWGRFNPSEARVSRQGSEAGKERNLLEDLFQNWPQQQDELTTHACQTLQRHGKKVLHGDREEGTALCLDESGS